MSLPYGNQFLESNSNITDQGSFQKDLLDKVLKLRLTVMNRSQVSQVKYRYSAESFLVILVSMVMVSITS